MPRPRKAPAVNMHILRWPCSFHGHHTVVVAGLDSMALTTARKVVESFALDDWPCTLTTHTFTSEETADILEGGWHGDLPI